MELSKKTWLILLVFFGLISLFADMVYESGRSIIGQYFFICGGPLVIASAMSGIGEFISYAVRYISGQLAPKMNLYWTLTFIGYFLSVIAIPLMGFFSQWEILFLLYLLDRLGKGIRAPARDALLASISPPAKYGKSFAIHEILDQIGAMVGPLLMSIILAFKSSYSFAFHFLFIFSIFTIFLIYFAHKYWKERMFGREIISYSDNASLQKKFNIIIFFGIFTFIGFPFFPFISYHFKSADILTDTLIPFLYSISMAIDGLVAYPLGVFFDKYKIKTIFIHPLLAIISTILIFSSSNFYVIFVGLFLWSICIASQETIFKSLIAYIASISNLAKNYGLFFSLSGISSMVGGAIMGWLYSLSPVYVIIFVIIAQIVSIFLIIACEYGGKVK